VLFHLTDDHVGAREEHPAVPQVVAGRHVLLGALQRGLFDEALDLEGFGTRAFIALRVVQRERPAALDVAEAGVRPVGHDAK
jgi:hypothetical protein